MDLEKRLTQAAAVGVLLVVLGLTGCGLDPISQATPPFISVIQDVSVFDANADTIIYSHLDRAECPPTYTPFGDLLQPDECDNLDENRVSVSTLYLLDPVTLDRVAIDATIGDQPQASRDARQIMWFDWSVDSIFVYDVETGQSSHHFEGNATSVASILLDVNDDYIVFLGADYSVEKQLMVYSTSTRQVVAELANQSVTTALEGDLLAYTVPTPGAGTINNSDDPATIDIVLFNIATQTGETIATEVPYGRFDNFGVFMHNGNVIWTSTEPTTQRYAIREYNSNTAMTRTILERDNSRADLIAATAVTDMSDLGLLVVQEPESGSGSVRYELVSWEGTAETLYDFPEQDRTWYRTDQPRFAGNRVLFSDPYTGEFRIQHLATGNESTFDPYVR